MRYREGRQNSVKTTVGNKAATEKGKETSHVLFLAFIILLNLFLILFYNFSFFNGPHIRLKCDLDMLVIAVNELYTPKSHTVSLGHLWLHVNPYVTISGPAGLAYSIQPTRQGGKES